MTSGFHLTLGAAEREREAREKKEEKLEKLRRLADGENQDKRGFSDPFYDKVRYFNPI